MALASTLIKIKKHICFNTVYTINNLMYINGTTYDPCRIKKMHARIYHGNASAPQPLAVWLLVAESHRSAQHLS